MSLSVTIITATFNSASTLRDTLQSVGNQDYPHLEHLIVDGVSKDETLDIARSFGHIQRIVSEPDKGLYDAMNKGIGLAQGDVIGILNSDDFYTHPQVIRKVAGTLESTGADMVYADLDYIHPVNTTKVLRHWKAGKYEQGMFLNGWMPPHPTLFVRRKVYEQYGCFNIDLRFSADYELMLRFIHRFGAKVSYIPEVTVKMRAGGVSNASLSNRLKANKEDRLAWEINGLQPHFYTRYLKPLSKIRQYFSGL